MITKNMILNVISTAAFLYALMVKYSCDDIKTAYVMMLIAFLTKTIECARYQEGKE